MIKIKLFINQSDWKGLNFQSEKDAWKKIKKNNVTIAANIFYAEKDKIYPAYVSKHNSNRKKQLILLMILNGEGWHYFAVKKISLLLKGTMSKRKCDFYCLNCIHFFRATKKSESHKRVCENKDFCNIIMSSEDIKILPFNQYKKFDKATFIVYTDLERLLEKMDVKTILKKTFTTKVGEHTPLGLSMPTISSFRNIENKHGVCRGKDCMKKFFESERLYEKDCFVRNQTKSFTKSFVSNSDIILYHVLFIKNLWISKLSLVSIGLKSTEKKFTTPSNPVFVILLIAKSFETLPNHSA